MVTPFRACLFACLVAVIALLACAGSDGTPAVLSVAPAQAIVGSSSVLTVTTSGFLAAPLFDLNADQGSVDRSMQFALIGPETLALNHLLRVGAGVFEGDVTPTMPGWYAVDATGGAGQHARLDHAFQVALPGNISGALLHIDSLTSPVATVYPGQTGVPLVVTVRNQGTTAADSVVVQPIFTRDGVIVSGSFYASSPALPLGSLAGGAVVQVPFMVEVQPAAMVGVVTLDAMAMGVESGTNIPVSVHGTTMTAMWTVAEGIPDAGVDVPSTPDVAVDTGSDAPPDVPTDAGVDAGMDVPLDLGFDSATDTRPDVGADAGVDAGIDAGGDAATDAAADVRVDASADVPGETGSDASADGATDAAMDAATDAGSMADADLGDGFEILSVTVTEELLTEVDFNITLYNGTDGVFTVGIVTPTLSPSGSAWSVEPLAPSTLPITMMPGARAVVHASASRGFGAIHAAFYTLDASATGIEASGRIITVPHANTHATILLP